MKGSKSGMVNAKDGKTQNLASQCKGVKSAIVKDGFSKADGDSYNRHMQHTGKPGTHKIKGC